MSPFRNYLMNDANWIINNDLKNHEIKNEKKSGFFGYFGNN